MRQVILDTETTGLEPEDGHRIIEIGALEMEDRQLTGRQFHYYLNPDREIDAGALEVHGITREFLEGKPRFTDIVEEFLGFVNNAELIIHNAPFDLGFLDYELALADRREDVLEGHAKVLDTLVLARDLHPGQRNNLDALCKRYDVDNTSRTLHGALLDAEILADVYLAMTGGQEDLGLKMGEVAADGGQMSTEAMQPVAPLKVLRASAEERQLHQQRLDSIQKQSGKCLWIEQGEVSSG